MKVSEARLIQFSQSLALRLHAMIPRLLVVAVSHAHEEVGWLVRIVHL